MAAEQKTDPDVAFAWEAPEGNFKFSAGMDGPGTLQKVDAGKYR